MKPDSPIRRGRRSRGQRTALDMNDKQTIRSPHDDLAAETEAVFPNVLCAVDGTRASFAAVGQAAALAGIGGHLTLLAVTSVAGAGRYRTAEISPARATQILDRAAEMASKAGVQCTGVVDPGGPAAEVILERAPKHELVAMGAPVSSWLGALFMGSAAFSTLRALSVPLLLARPLADPASFARRILVASDGLDGSDRLVELAARLGRRHVARTIMVHALGAESQLRPHRIEAQARALKLAIPRDSQVLVEPGDARRLIVDTANHEEVTLVVIGSRRPEGLNALGSVSKHIVHDVACSVLVVPSEFLQG
jgi:nucleotide-binding universal stress UspA family protein